MKKRILRILSLFLITFMLSYFISYAYIIKNQKDEVYAIASAEEVRIKIITLLAMAGIKIQNQAQINDLPERFQEIEMQSNAVWSKAVTTALSVEAYILTVTPDIQQALLHFKNMINQTPVQSINETAWENYSPSPFSLTIYPSQILMNMGGVITLFYSKANNYHCNQGTTPADSTYHITCSPETNYFAHYNTSNNTWVVGGYTGNIRIDSTNILLSHTTGFLSEDLASTLLPSSTVIDYTDSLDSNYSINDYTPGETVQVNPAATDEMVIGNDIPTTLGNIATFPDEIQSTETDTDILTRIHDKVIGIPSAIGTIVGGLFIPTDSPSINLGPLEGQGSAIFTKFPFSIPWDLKNGIESLKVDALAPHFIIDFPEENFIGGGTVDIDFSTFSTWAAIVRWGILIGFIFSLIVLTNKLIGRN